MAKPESIPCTTTYSCAPPPPLPPPPPPTYNAFAALPPPYQPTYSAFTAPPPPPPPSNFYQSSQDHSSALLPAVESLPPLPTTTSDPMRTTTWGPVTYTRKPSRKGHKSDKNKKHKKKAHNEERHEEVTLSGRERSWTWETVEVLADGGVRKTWVTDIKVITEEVVKQVEGPIEEEKKERKKDKKSKGSKEDSSSDDSDESDEGDPIEELARLTNFHGSVIGRVPPVRFGTLEEWNRRP